MRKQGRGYHYYYEQGLVSNSIYKKSISRHRAVESSQSTLASQPILLRRKQAPMYDQKQLTERISMLEKENAQLKTQLKEKEVTINSINKLMQLKDSEYSQLIKKEQQSHEQTEERLKQAESLAAEKLQILYESRKEFGEKTEHLNKLHEEKLATVIKENASEITCRDEKIRKLKQQVSEVLEGKSWERQQQLHELKKEVIRLTEEASALQKKLKLHQSFKKDCKNCG
ncbi:golgin subfamily A member 6-like protein 22 isoform X2 [Amblyraja radiata]|uniref:golgin subfamily A member 6-like protein 22 isoform X2 n=1 Tax=Amblyraja radiata TaxID=386614 RepID=UPI001402ED05|nr:golgin subfamily A member 6-like protein 22 isoform X2 [Amblyraja radiata]